MELEPIIGLEIHVQLKTKSKMFCSCPNIFGDVKPNTAICPICLAYPGTLPVPNQQAIKWIQVVGAALNCELAQNSKFDRKHYFYPDLPKGYQISQFDQPFCRHGSLDIIEDANTISIGITRVHLEEDAAKNIHPKDADYTLVDYNRAGTPLVEIVTEPDIRTPQQARIFLQELQRLIRFLNVSDADMEKGQMLCDANISLREKGTDKFNPKTEIKNLNSFRFVEQALAYEIERQTKEWATSQEGKLPPSLSHQSTLGFDSKAGQTYSQRTKEEAADYRYFPEPDIPPFEFTDQALRQIEVDLPELPHVKQARFMRQYATPEQTAQTLVSYPHLADFFEKTVSEIEQLDQEQGDISTKDIKPLVKLAANIILRDLRDTLKNSKTKPEKINITPANFAELIVLIHQGKISKNSLPKVLKEMQITGGDPDHIIQNLGLEQVSDTNELTSYVDEVIKDNPDIVAKIKAGKEGAIQFLMGQAMQKTKGQGNPQEIIQLLREKLL
jgi:aspartyl-tRNA(Asn)/glutamyl-tRNA(Gln) amidotransferase subunit B